MEEKKYPPFLFKAEYLGIPSKEQEKYAVKKIKEILIMNPSGITIRDITDKTPFTRPTITKHLEWLVSRRDCFKRRFGALFIYFPNKELHPNKVTMEIGERKFMGSLIRNDVGEFVLIKEGTSGVLVKKEEFILFQEFIEKVKKELVDSEKA